jgi:hypothetical protein
MDVKRFVLDCLRGVKGFKCIILLAISTLLFPLQLLAEDALIEVKVIDAYIEMRSGPGTGYPVVHVAERGETIEILTRRTTWYKIKTTRGNEGWAKRQDMSRTLNLDGSAVGFKDATIDDFAKRTWETGFATGYFDKAPVLSIYGAYHFTENLSIALNASQAIGEYSDNSYATLNLVHQPFPTWRVSPYFTIGTGLLKTQPHATLIETESRESELLQAGIGAKIYLSQRFILRLDVKNNLVLTKRNDNEELVQWTLGISVFF